MVRRVCQSQGINISASFAHALYERVTQETQAKVAAHGKQEKDSHGDSKMREKLIELNGTFCFFRARSVTSKLDSQRPLMSREATIITSRMTKPV